MDTFSQICWVIQYLAQTRGKVQLALAVTKVTPIFDCPDTAWRSWLTHTSANHHIHKEGGTKSPAWWRTSGQPYLGFRGQGDGRLMAGGAKQVFFLISNLGRWDFPISTLFRMQATG